MNFVVPGCFRTVWKGRWASKRRLERARAQYNSVFNINWATLDTLKKLSSLEDKQVRIECLGC